MKQTMLPRFAKLRARVQFEPVTYALMMFAYIAACVGGIVALCGETWCGAFAVFCLAIGALIEAREWHRNAEIFAYLMFVRAREFEVMKTLAEGAIADARRARSN